MNKLSLRHQILFGVGGLGANVVFQAATAWLFFFWAGRGDPALAIIPIGFFGLLLGVGRVIESFDDPLIGYLSDRTKSRWGRRFPFVFFGAPVLAITFFLLWAPFGHFEGTWVNIVYFFIVLQAFFLAYTLVEAPYEGILPEIAKTSKQRVSVSIWRVFFGVIGAGIGLVGSAFLIERFGFLGMGLSLGALASVSFWISIFGIRKILDTRTEVAAQPPPARAFAEILKNRQFLFFAASLILFAAGLNLLTATMPFFVTVILGQSEGAVGIFSAVVLVSMLAALPIQLFLSSKKSKRWLYSRSMLLLAFLFPLLAFVGLAPGLPALWQFAIVLVPIGLVLSGQFVFPHAILADIIDFDETRTGARREAIYYGMQNTLLKLSFALSSIILGTALAVFGSTADDSLGIRLIGPIAAVITFAGFIIFVRGYTLPDKVKTK